MAFCVVEFGVRIAPGAEPQQLFRDVMPLRWMVLPA
jgi:hypothetical protein